MGSGLAAPKGRTHGCNDHRCNVRETPHMALRLIRSTEGLGPLRPSRVELFRCMVTQATVPYRHYEANPSSATSHRPWRTCRPLAALVHCHSGGQFEGTA